MSKQKKEVRNKIDKPEQMDVGYSGAYVKFHTVVEKDSHYVHEAGSFRLLPEMFGKIIRQDNATVVILNDGSKGVAKCGEKEVYSRSVGLRIAYNRAVIAYLQKMNDTLGETLDSIE